MKITVEHRIKAGGNEIVKSATAEIESPTGESSIEETVAKLIAGLLSASIDKITE